jgi:pilus assembly protein Flp/PilA
MYAALSAVRDRVASRFGSTDRGATAVEYGLLVGLIAVIIIVGVALLGTTLLELFNGVAGEIPGVGGGTTP